MSKHCTLCWATCICTSLLALHAQVHKHCLACSANGHTCVLCCACSCLYAHDLHSKASVNLLGVHICSFQKFMHFFVQCSAVFIFPDTSVFFCSEGIRQHFERMLNEWLREFEETKDMVMKLGPIAGWT